MITLSDPKLQNISPETLGELLIEAKKAYYTSSRPIMDDHTYDTLENILRQKLPYHRIFTKVGTPNFDTGWAKKSHTHPMSSQNKVNTLDDLIHYFELKKLPPKTKFVVQPKCDGLSVEIEYKNGKLVGAITRGDGLVGDLITQNVVRMKNFVANPLNFSGSIRCEIVVTSKDFKKLNVIARSETTKQSPQCGDRHTSLVMTYSNPRNAASGLSQRLDSKYAHFCTLIPVDIISVETRDRASLQIETEQQKINLLKSLGITPVETHLCSDFNAIEKIFQDLLVKRTSYPFDIDGLVVKINNLEIAGKLGSLNNRPKFQVAYKFPASTNTSTIKNIVWQVGPMGAITPVAEIEPIELSGAIISFASLANHDLVQKMNLNIGDIVQISRRGDVIPHIEKVVTKVNPGHSAIPTHCPDCKSLLIKEGKMLRCPNQKNCLSQIIGSLNLFCQTLNILGLSDKTIAKLYTVGRVKTPGDFYKLKVSDIEDLDNLGEKSARNIINQIQSKKTLTLKQVFDSAIIPNFSSARIQQLITAGFDTPTKILNLTSVNLLKIKGFQKTLAQKIIDGIALRREWINSILSQVHLKLDIRNLTLKGLTFCITGTLSVSRQKLIDLIETNGGIFVSAVSSNTNYLIANSSSDSDKYKSAVKFKIKIISENDFQKLL